MTTIEPPALPRETALTWRGIGPGDLDPWLALIRTVEEHDEKRERTTSSDLRALTELPYVDLDADARVGLDGDGTFRAYARNSFRSGAVDEHHVVLAGGVHPDWRARGLGRALLSWQWARAVGNVASMRAADAASVALPARIGAFVGERAASRARLFEHAGFVPTRWFNEMRRSLDGAGTRRPGDLPDSLRLEAFGDRYAERVRLAHNDAFLDHWGSTPETRESWRTDLLEQDVFRRELSYVIVDPTAPGEPVVAYVLNAEFPEEWAARGFTEGFTLILGVLREWRGRGLARRLMELSAEVFAERGHHYAALGVDADNPAGAFRLYESLGYAAAHTSTYYSLPV